MRKLEIDSCLDFLGMLKIAKDLGGNFGSHLTGPVGDKFRFICPFPIRDTIQMWDLMKKQIEQHGKNK